MTRRARRRKSLGPELEAFLEDLYTGGPIETHRVRPSWPGQVNKWFGNPMLMDVKLDGRDFIDLTEEGKYYMGADWDDIDKLLEDGERAQTITEVEEGFRDDELKVPLYHCPFCDANQPGPRICEACGETADQSPPDDGPELQYGDPGVFE